MTERDPLIRRLERSALMFCLGAAALTAATGRGDMALGVIAGGVLIGASYWTIKSGLDGFMRVIGGQLGAMPPGAAADDAATPETQGQARIHKGKLALALGRVVGRYALLGFMAYVMIARLRLHPIGLILGASSIVAAAGIETARSFGAGRTGRGGS